MSVDRHQDRQDVVDVVVKVARILDDRTWDRLHEAFLSDAVAYGEQGIDAIRALLIRFLGNCGPSQHLLANFEVTLDGDSARCVSRLRVFHQGLDDPTKWNEDLGEYTDELVRTDAGWRIAHRQLDVKIRLGDTSVLEAERS